MPELSVYSRRVAELLERLGAQPVRIGALAALEYRATQRYTTDADFLIRDVPGIVPAFEKLGCAVRVNLSEDGVPFLYAIRGGGDVRVDLVVAETPYQEEAHARAEGGTITAEDVIVHKLIAWRQRDRDDIRSILAAGHALDEAYIERWAAEWEVTDRWEAARRGE